MLSLQLTYSVFFVTLIIIINQLSHYLIGHASEISFKFYRYLFSNSEKNQQKGLQPPFKHTYLCSAAFDQAIEVGYTFFS